jgi:hypothetical protein
MTFPFFGALLGFFDGFAFAPTTYFVSTHLATCCHLFKFLVIMLVCRNWIVV